MYESLTIHRELARVGNELYNQLIMDSGYLSSEGEKFGINKQTTFSGSFITEPIPATIVGYDDYFYPPRKLYTDPIKMKLKFKIISYKMKTGHTYSDYAWNYCFGYIRLGPVSMLVQFNHFSQISFGYLYENKRKGYLMFCMKNNHNLRVITSMENIIINLFDPFLKLNLSVGIDTKILSNTFQKLI